MTETDDSKGRRGGLTEAEREAYVRSTRRFDLRRILGGLFVLYGLVVGITGIVNFDGDAAKTGGIHVSLWTGIGMLVLGLLFFLWDALAPVSREDIVANLERQEDERLEGEGRERPAG